jgi:hypothetical protein
LTGKDCGAGDQAGEKHTGQDKHHQAKRMRRRLKPSHLPIQEFPVVAIHIHLDPDGKNSLAVYLFRRSESV